MVGKPLPQNSLPDFRQHWGRNGGMLVLWEKLPKKKRGREEEETEKGRRRILKGDAITGWLCARAHATVWLQPR